MKDAIVTVLLAIITIGMVAVVVSQQAKTTAVLGTAFNGLSNFMGTAMSPVTGQMVQPMAVMG